MKRKAPTMLSNGETNVSREFRLGWWRFCVVLLLMPFSLFVNVARCADLPDFEGDAELLNLVAVQNRANYEALMTWRGRLRIKEFNSKPGRPDRRYENTVDFAFDRGLEAKRWNWSCDKFKMISEGTEQDGPNVGFQSGMLKDGAYYQLRPVQSTSQVSRRTVTINAAEEFSFSPHSTDFDPMYYLTDHGELLWQRFDTLYKRSLQGKAKGWRVSRSGVVVSLDKTVDVPEYGIVVNKYQVDLAKGANLISFESSDPSVTESHTLDYEEVEGVWVPKHLDYLNKNSNSGKVYRREAAWEESVVNDASDESLFSLASLGALNGDLVRDSRANLKYVIGATDDIGDGESVSKTIFNWTWFLIIINLVIVFLLLFLVWRHRTANAN